MDYFVYNQRFTSITKKSTISSNWARVVIRQRWARIQRARRIWSPTTFFEFGSGFEFSGKTGCGTYRMVCIKC